MKKKLISIVTPCYNEEDNIDELCQRIANVMAALPYDYEHICIDNYSTDSTVSKIKAKAAIDKTDQADRQCTKLWTYQVTLLRNTAI